MNLDFNNMDDEQFQKEFIKFLTLHQSSIKNLIESNKKNNPFNPFNSKSNFDVDEDYIKRIFNNIHNNLNLNNDEEWERKDFTDPTLKED